MTGIVVRCSLFVDRLRTTIPEQRIRAQSMLPILRILTGLIFVVSGAEKLIWPWQNFLYAIQSYEFFPPGADAVVAHVFPWIEFLTGLFLALGLWVGSSLKAALVMYSAFILIIAQALIRHLPINECGCFGALLSLKPQHTLLMDSFFFLSLIWLLKNVKGAEKFSLDAYFKK